MEIKLFEDYFIKKIKCHLMSLWNMKIIWHTIIICDSFLFSFSKSFWDGIIRIYRKFLVQSNHKIWIWNCYCIRIIKNDCVLTFSLSFLFHLFNQKFKMLQSWKCWMIIWSWFWVHVNGSLHDPFFKSFKFKLSGFELIHDFKVDQFDKCLEFVFCQESLFIKTIIIKHFSKFS